MSMSVLLTLPYSNQSELSSLLEAIQTPGGPDYHHYLTGAQFDSEFGGSPQTYSALAGLLASYGVTAVTTRADRASLSFLATGTEVSEVFHTQIGVFRTENGWVFYAPRTAPQLPTTLVDASVSVQGLSNYSNYLVSTDLETSHMPGGGTADRPSPPPPANRQAICNSDLLGAINYTSVGGYSYPEPVDGSKWGCGQYIFGSDLQVTYGVTPLYARGSPPPGPTNVSIATLLWTEPVYATGYCTGVSTYDNAWDFYAPDVSTYFADTLPSGEPQPHVASMATPVSSPYS
jgi:subtilase family serine protease